MVTLSFKLLWFKVIVRYTTFKSLHLFFFCQVFWYRTSYLFYLLSSSFVFFPFASTYKCINTEHVWEISKRDNNIHNSFHLFLSDLQSHRALLAETVRGTFFLWTKNNKQNKWFKLWDCLKKVCFLVI